MAGKEYKHPPRRRHVYTPPTLRTPTLVSFAVICLFCIAGIEYLVRLKPLKEYGTGVSDLTRRDLEPVTTSNAISGRAMRIQRFERRQLLANDTASPHSPVVVTTPVAETSLARPGESLEPDVPIFPQEGTTTTVPPTSGNSNNSPSAATSNPSEATVAPGTSIVAPLPSDIFEGEDPSTIIIGPEELPSVSLPTTKVLSTQSPNGPISSQQSPISTVTISTPGGPVITITNSGKQPSITRPAPVTLPPSTITSMVPTVIVIPSTITTSRTIRASQGGSSTIVADTSVADIRITTAIPTTTILPPKIINAVNAWTRTVTVRDPTGTALITSKATILADSHNKPGTITRTITGVNGRLTQALEITLIESTVIGEHTTIIARTMLLVPPAASASATAGPGERPALGRDGVAKDEGFKGATAGFPSFWVSRLPDAEFLGQALFMVVAVLMAMLFRAIDRDVKRIEVWYRLSNRAGGGLAGSELFIPDLTFSNAFVAPMLAVRRREWIVALSAVVYGPLLWVLLLMSSSAVLVSAEGLCGAPIGNDGEMACGAYVSIRPSLARGLEVVLALIAVAVIALAVLLRLRRPRLLLRHTPFTIAGLALLMTRLEGLEVLGGSDANRSLHDLRQRIGDVRFRLVELSHPNSSVKAVLEAFSQDERKSVRVTSGVADACRGEGARGKRPFMVRFPMMGVLVAVIVGALVLICIYRFSPSSGSKFEQFLSRTLVGPRIFSTSLGIIINSLCEPIIRESRHHEPIRHLRLRHAAPKILTTDFTMALPLLFSSLHPHSFSPYSLLLSVLPLLTATLTIHLSAVPFSPGMTNRAFVVSTTGSIVILLLLLLILPIMMYRRKTDALPRKPYSIPVMASYLYAARMGRALDELVWDVHSANRGDGMRIVRSGLEAGGKKFGIGWTVGVDGVVRVGVDEEELMSDWIREVHEEVESERGSMESEGLPSSTPTSAVSTRASGIALGEAANPTTGTSTPPFTSASHSIPITLPPLPQFDIPIRLYNIPEHPEASTDDIITIGLAVGHSLNSDSELGSNTDVRGHDYHHSLGEHEAWISVEMDAGWSAVMQR